METKLTWSNVAESNPNQGEGQASLYLRLKPGDNPKDNYRKEYVVRLLSEPVKYEIYFIAEGLAPVYKQNASEEIIEKFKPVLRFACYVYNQDEKCLQIAELPWTIVKAIGALSKSSQYSFEGLPPFDISLIREGKGMKTEYSVTPGRNEENLSPEVVDELSKKKDIQEWLNERIAKQAGEDTNPNATEEDKNPFSENTKKK